MLAGFVIALQVLGGTEIPIKDFEGLEHIRNAY